MDVCTANSYDNIADYEWLVCKVMFGLASILNEALRKNFEDKIAQVLIDISERLEDVRKKAITLKCASIFEKKEAENYMGVDSCSFI